MLYHCRRGGTECIVGSIGLVTESMKWWYLSELCFIICLCWVDACHDNEKNYEKESELSNTSSSCLWDPIISNWNWSIMNEHARLILQHRTRGGKKVPLFEGCCEASVSAKPKALDMWRRSAYADDSQKFSLQKDLLYICFYWVWTKPKPNAECGHTVWCFSCSVLFSLWFGEDVNIFSLWHFRLKQYLTFLPVIWILLWVDRLVMYSSILCRS